MGEVYWKVLERTLVPAGGLLAMGAVRDIAVRFVYMEQDGYYVFTSEQAVMWFSAAKSSAAMFERFLAWMPNAEPGDSICYETAGGDYHLTCIDEHRCTTIKEPA